MSIFSPELVCASVCQSSCRATSTVLESRTSSGPLPMKPLSAAICERSRLSHWYSEPISPSLSLLFSVSGFVNLGWSALFYEQLCMMRTNWSDGEKIFHLFLRFFHRGSLDDYDNGISVGRLSVPKNPFVARCVNLITGLLWSSSMDRLEYYSKLFSSFLILLRILNFPCKSSFK